MPVGVYNNLLAGFKDQCKRCFKLMGIIGEKSHSPASNPQLISLLFKLGSAAVHLPVAWLHLLLIGAFRFLCASASAESFSTNSLFAARF